MDLNLISIVFLVLLSFIAQLMNASLGMGFGTIAIPAFILLGYDPIEVVPPLLMVQVFSGIISALFHHSYGNIDLSEDSKARKVAVILTFFSIIGGGSAALLAVDLPQFFIKVYIGVIAVAMGIMVLVFRNKRIRFSWMRISFLGFFASFNKGISGAGYGPIITSGQILSGLDSKSSVSISSFTEAISCLTALLVYLLEVKVFNFIIVLPLLLGSFLSIPVAVRIVKNSEEKKLILTIGFMTIMLGIATLLKIYIF